MQPHVMNHTPASELEFGMERHLLFQSDRIVI